MTLPVTFAVPPAQSSLRRLRGMRHSAPTSALSSSLKLSGALRSLPQPQLYAVVHKGMRRVTAERFPYSVYFRAETRRVVVLAVFHGSRDPAIWQHRA